MKKCALFLFLLFITNGYCQCDIKTTNRPNGVIMKYFTPKPVARAAKHEAGLSLYYNVQTKQYTLSIFVLHKGTNPKVLEGNLVIHTTNTNGISLKPYLHKMIKMNGQDVASSIFYLQQSDINELKKYPLKTLAFIIDGEIVGMTVTENSNLLNDEFNCLNNILQPDKNKGKSYDDNLLDTIALSDEYKKWATEENIKLATQNAFDYEKHQIDFDNTNRDNLLEHELYGETETYSEDCVKWSDIKDTLIGFIAVVFFASIFIWIAYKMK